MLKLYRPNKNEIYGIHDPIGLRFLFQLRVDLSPLKYHKYSHHFLDIINPQCLCNDDVENTCHYLLKCPLFLESRGILLDSVLPILSARNLHEVTDLTLVKILLYGHSSLTNQENCLIIKATINYLKNSGRFKV